MAGREGRNRSVAELTDEELSRYILTRLALIGVDLSVLPEEDGEAPADQARVLRSARGFLRTTVPTLSDYPLDPQDTPPVQYPAALAPLLEEDGGRAR